MLQRHSESREVTHRFQPTADNMRTVDEVIDQFKVNLFELLKWLLFHTPHHEADLHAQQPGCVGQAIRHQCVVFFFSNFSNGSIFGPLPSGPQSPTLSTPFPLRSPLVAVHHIIAVMVNIDTRVRMGFPAKAKSLKWISPVYIFSLLSSFIYRQASRRMWINKASH